MFTLSQAEMILNYFLLDDALSADSDDESLSSSSEGSSSSGSSSSSSSEDEEDEGEGAESDGLDSMDESTMDSTNEKDDRYEVRNSVFIPCHCLFHVFERG